MKYIVSGAAGFIGSSLCEYFFNNNIEHIGFDNFSYGYKDNVYEGDKPKFNFVECDVCSEKIYELVDNGDIIIHLAAISSLPENQANPLSSFKNNNYGTINLLEVCRKKGVSHFIFASTSAVYENSTVFPSKEDEKLEQPYILYSLGKKQCEEYCKSYEKLYKIPYTILRFFNVYGPKNDYDRLSPPLIPYIIRELCNKREPILHGSGEQCRDYIYIDDLINAIIAVTLQPVAKNKIYNISSNKTISVKEIYSIIATQLNINKEAKYRSEENFWNDYSTLNEGKYTLNKEYLYKEVNKYTQGENTKAQRELNWTPKIDMKTGLCRVIEYYLSKKRLH